jgi:hypothetical protein
VAFAGQQPPTGGLVARYRNELREQETAPPTCADQAREYRAHPDAALADLGKDTICPACDAHLGCDVRCVTWKQRQLLRDHRRDDDQRCAARRRFARAGLDSHAVVAQQRRLAHAAKVHRC